MWTNFFRRIKTALSFYSNFPPKIWLTMPKQFFYLTKRIFWTTFFYKKDHTFVILIQFCSKHFDWCSPNSLICFSTDEVNTSNEHFFWEDIKLFVFLLQLCSKSLHWFLPNCFRPDHRDTLNERFSEEKFFLFDLTCFNVFLLRLHKLFLKW